MSIRERVGFILLAGISLPLAASAQGFFGSVQQGASAVAGPSGLTQVGDLSTITGNVIGLALSLVGVILLVLLIYAGFLWMTAGGNQDQVKKARTMIINAVVGLLILVSAYAIVNFVLTQLASTTTGVTGGGANGPTP